MDREDKREYEKIKTKKKKIGEKIEELNVQLKELGQREVELIAKEIKVIQDVEKIDVLELLNKFVKDEKEKGKVKEDDKKQDN